MTFTIRNTAPTTIRGISLPAYYWPEFLVGPIRLRLADDSFTSFTTPEAAEAFAREVIARASE